MDAFAGVPGHAAAARRLACAVPARPYEVLRVRLAGMLALCCCCVFVQCWGSNMSLRRCVRTGHSSMAVAVGLACCRDRRGATLLAAACCALMCAWSEQWLRDHNGVASGRCLANGHSCLPPILVVCRVQQGRSAEVQRGNSRVFLAPGAGLVVQHMSTCMKYGRQWQCTRPHYLTVPACSGTAGA